MNEKALISLISRRAENNRDQTTKHVKGKKVKEFQEVNEKEDKVIEITPEASA